MTNPHKQHHPTTYALTTLSQTKMALHASRHGTASAPVHGVLLGFRRPSPDGDRRLVLADAVPICHEAPTKPLVEAALRLVEGYLDNVRRGGKNDKTEEDGDGDGDVKIVGWYTANAHVPSAATTESDTAEKREMPNIPAMKIASSMSESRPRDHLEGDFVLALVSTPAWTSIVNPPNNTHDDDDDDDILVLRLQSQKIHQQSRQIRQKGISRLSFLSGQRQCQPRGRIRLRRAFRGRFLSWRRRWRRRKRRRPRRTRRLEPSEGLEKSIRNFGGSHEIESDFGSKERRRRRLWWKCGGRSIRGQPLRRRRRRRPFPRGDRPLQIRRRGRRRRGRGSRRRRSPVLAFRDLLSKCREFQRHSLRRRRQSPFQAVVSRLRPPLDGAIVGSRGRNGGGRNDLSDFGEAASGFPIHRRDDRGGGRESRGADGERLAERRVGGFAGGGRRDVRGAGRGGGGGGEGAGTEVAGNESQDFPPQCDREAHESTHQRVLVLHVCFAIRLVGGSHRRTFGREEETHTHRQNEEQTQVHCHFEIHQSTAAPTETFGKKGRGRGRRPRKQGRFRRGGRRIRRRRRRRRQRRRLRGRHGPTPRRRQRHQRPVLHLRAGAASSRRRSRCRPRRQSAE
mmetsp:Transcript_22986/g.48652  ORF Transcript_22986/g.48652 Transcript_22986/m.48652 type:complete len:623 (-) Transcript_22986:374-2242(-)